MLSRASSLGGAYNADPVNTPEEFWPLTGLNQMSIDQSIASGTVDLETALAAVQQKQVEQGAPTRPQLSSVTRRAPS